MKAKPGNRRRAGADQWGLARFHFLVGLGWIRLEPFSAESAECGVLRDAGCGMRRALKGAGLETGCLVPFRSVRIHREPGQAGRMCHPSRDAPRFAGGHRPGGLAELGVVGSRVQVVFRLTHEAILTQVLKIACCRAT